jgi:hypothetical protein
MEFSVLVFAGKTTSDIRKEALDFVVANLNVDGSRGYSCHFCNYKSIRLDNVQLHVISRHMADVTVQCPVCSKMYKNFMSLTKHQKRCIR